MTGIDTPQITAAQDAIRTSIKQNPQDGRDILIGSLRSLEAPGLSMPESLTGTSSCHRQRKFVD